MGRRFTRSRGIRLIVQLVFFILAPQVFSMAFAGARYIFACFGKGDAIELTSFVVLLVGLCIYTVLFGRFFCGYVCAFGTLGDMLYEIGNLIAVRLGVKRRRMPEKVQGKLRYLKFVILVALLIASTAGVSSIVGAASPWTAFGRLTNLQFVSMGIVGTVLLLLICVGMIWQERFFCEYLCPLGAIFSLLPILPLSNFRRDMDMCIECGQCERECPVNIYPPGENGQMGECIQCARCCDVCPVCCVHRGTPAAKGASGAAAANSPAGDENRDNRGTIVRCVVLAIVLLAFFWVVGSVNYLPTLNWG